MSETDRTLFCIGTGYVATALARRLRKRGWRIVGATRRKERAPALRADGIEVLHPEGDFPAAFSSATHILISAPPTEGGDVLLARHAELLASGADRLAWIGYLSSTAVYGDCEGEWVSEDSVLRPGTSRGRHREQAEVQWRRLHDRNGKPVLIFRLAGIYGPGRNALVRVLNGQARRIIKRGHVFSRVHVEDICATLEASMEKPEPGLVYNVTDDEPASQDSVLRHAADLLRAEPPPAISAANAGMSGIAREFYAECRRVSNLRLKKRLLPGLAYPTYREGLAALRQELGPVPA